MRFRDTCTILGLWLLSGCVYVEDDDLSADGEPVAHATLQNTEPILVGITPVMLDATTSVATGAPPAFAWRVTAPTGARLPILSPFEPAITIPSVDLDGDYTARVVVTSDGKTDSFELTFRANNRSPRLAVSICGSTPDRLELNGDSLLIDGDLTELCVSVADSSDPDGHELSAGWSVEQVPQGSRLPLDQSDGMSHRFELDVAGVYQGLVWIDDGFGGQDERTWTFVRR